MTPSMRSLAWNLAEKGQKECFCFHLFISHLSSARGGGGGEFPETGDFSALSSEGVDGEMAQVWGCGGRRRTMSEITSLETGLRGA